MSSIKIGKISLTDLSVEDEFKVKQLNLSQSALLQAKIEDHLYSVFDKKTGHLILLSDNGGGWRSVISKHTFTTFGAYTKFIDQDWALYCKEHDVRTNNGCISF